MLTILICALVGAWFGWFVDADEAMAFFDGCLGAFMGLILALVLFGMIGRPYEVETLRTALPSLSDRLHTEGHFSLFSGSINSVPHYAWYEETAPNTYEQKSVEANGARIHLLEPGTAPYYTRSTKRYKNDLGLWGIYVSDEDSRRYDFYVPQGSIQRDYKLDAE